MTLTSRQFYGERGNRSHMTQKLTGHLPISFLLKLKGKNNEENLFRKSDTGRMTQIQWENFVCDIKIRGIQHKILIIVDWMSEPFVYEGNHRIRAAAAARLDEVPVEVRCFGCAEFNYPL